MTIRTIFSTYRRPLNSLVWRRKNQSCASKNWSRGRVSSTVASRLARIVAKSILRMRTIIGLADSIKAIMEARCGGAVAKLAKINQVVNGVCTSRKMMKMMTWMRSRTTKPRKPRSMYAVLAVKKSVTWSMTALVIQTWKLVERQSKNLKGSKRWKTSVSSTRIQSCKLRNCSKKQWWFQSNMMKRGTKRRSATPTIPSCVAWWSSMTTITHCTIRTCLSRTPSTPTMTSSKKRVRKRPVSIQLEAVRHLLP